MTQLNTEEKEFVQVMAKITIESINRLKRATGWVDNYPDLIECQKSFLGENEYQGLKNKTPDDIYEYQKALLNRGILYENIIENPNNVLGDLPEEEYEYLTTLICEHANKLPIKRSVINSTAEKLSKKLKSILDESTCNLQ